MAVSDIITGTPFILNTIIMIISIFIIFKSAGYMIYGIEKFGRRFGLSDSFLGLFVVGTAVSVPAILSSLNGILLSDAQITLGSILGANLLTIGFFVGFSGFKYKTLSLKSIVFSRSLFYMWGLIVLPLIMLLDGNLTRIDGSILLVLFFIYLRKAWLAEEASGRLKKDISIKTSWKSALIFVLALAALLLSSRWLVFSSSVIADQFGIPTYFAALTVVAIGTTLPSFALKFRAEKEKASNLAMGTYVGRMLVTFVFFFGLIGVLHPISVEASRLLYAASFMLVCITILFIAQKKQAIAKYAGLAMLVLYFIFIGLELLKSFAEAAL